MLDEEYMRLALKEAEKSFRSGDVPCGAIIVLNEKIIAMAHNEREKRRLTTAHAEIVAINKANKYLKRNRLDGACIYITKEPCLMCMGAILSARISKIVFGAYDPRFGTQYLAQNNQFNHKCDIVGGVLENECGAMLSNFFGKLRERNASSRRIKVKDKSTR